MHRKALLDQLARYRPLDAADADCLRRFIEFVKNHERCFERTLSLGHITGSAWIADPSDTKTLLVHHRKLGRWVQPGGHCDGNPDVLAVALQEGREETGLRDLCLVEDAIFDLDIHLIPARGLEPAHFHYDVRYAFQARDGQSPAVSHESLALAWVPLERLQTYSSEVSLLRMARKWQGRFPSVTL